MSKRATRSKQHFFTDVDTAIVSRLLQQLDATKEKLKAQTVRCACELQFH